MLYCRVESTAFEMKLYIQWNLSCGISELSSLSESERRIWQDDEM
jgi:hypothetical protein